MMSDPFVVMNVPEDDMLSWGWISSGQDELILVTAAGQAIRFKEEEVRPMGLQAGGVLGIKLKGEDDGLIAMTLARFGTHLWTVADNGYAKYTTLDEYPIQGRYGQGVIAMSLPKSARALVGAVVARPKDSVTIITARGITRTMRLNASPETARARHGEQVLKPASRDQVAGVIVPTPAPNSGG